MSIESALARVAELQALIAPAASPAASRPANPAPPGSFQASLERASRSEAAPGAGATAAAAGSGPAAPVRDRSPSGGGFAWPVQARVTSPFGPRWGRMHSGIDLGAAQGTPVKAAADGRVKTAAYQGGYGNLVVIEHANGVETRYAHLASLGVRAGETVAAGEQVGRVGSTGHSTGPHLHFELRVRGQARDPLDYLPRR